MPYAVHVPAAALEPSDEQINLDDVRQRLSWSLEVNI